MAECFALSWLYFWGVKKDLTLSSLFLKRITDRCDRLWVGLEGAEDKATFAHGWRLLPGLASGWPPAVPASSLDCTLSKLTNFAKLKRVACDNWDNCSFCPFFWIKRDWVESSPANILLSKDMKKKNKNKTMGDITGSLSSSFYTVYVHPRLSRNETKKQLHQGWRELLWVVEQRNTIR